MMVTLKDIARRTGVSYQTASRVLGGQAQLHTPDTRQRVLDAAHDLGYRPNSSARSMRTGRFGGVGLLLSARPGRSYVPQEMIMGVQASLAGHDLHLTVGTLADDQLVNSQKLPKLLREWMVDGLLINYTHQVPQAMVELIQRHAVPSIWMNIKAECDCVYPDDYAGALEGTRRLIEMGHRRIAYAHPHQTLEAVESGQLHFSAADRLAGYRAAMDEAGLPGRFLDPEALVRPHAVQPLVDQLRGPEAPTALVVYHASSIIELYKACRAAGIRLPDDLAMLTVGGAFIRQAGLPIATMWSEEFNRGDVAVASVLEKIETPTRRLAPRALPFTYDWAGLMERRPEP